MSKKDWKKQLLRMKQLADQNLGRSEKSEVLTDDLQLLERQVNQIRDAWQSIVKKLQACLASHTGEAEKRLRKLPEYAFTNCLGDLASTFNVETIQGKSFNLCGEAQLCLAKGLVQYGFEIEAKVIQPAQILLERDIPAILKLRRQLANMTLDMDSAKSRYQALCKQTQSSATAARLDAAREELDTAETKVEHCKDVFATEMYTFFAREEELCQMLLQLMEAQATYHRQSLDALDRLIPTLKEEIDLLATRPVFGLSLEDHLRYSKREIATVMEDCVVAILRTGLDVEGIFRIAPGASKVKKLKAAFDANMVDADEYDNDIHCFCAALKHYLRELPQPIMTFELYDEWIMASQRPADQRLNALWVVVDKLPKHSYTNLRYLIKFLAKVTEHSDLNKMNASNLAIVFGPNLLWSPIENRNDIHATSCLTLVVETLIGSSEWFFPGDIDFPSSNSFPSSTLTSSSSDIASNRAQAKVAFLAGGGDGGNGDSSAASDFITAGNVLEHSQGPEANVAAVTSTVATNVFKPPRKTKKAAPAPPVASGNHHQRSASVTILTSTLQELTSSSVTTRDDLLDRKAATMTRPKVPPPARPALPSLPPVQDHPVQIEVASGKDELSFGRENISQSQNMLPPFAKKPVSRSLDDVVSESRRGDGSELFAANTSSETEAVSDSEDVFPHRGMHDVSFNMAVAQSEDSEASFGPDEQDVVSCLDNVLSQHDRSLSSQASAEQSVHQEKLTEHDGSNSTKLLSTVRKSSAESRASTQMAQNLSSEHETAYPVSAPNVSVEPPTPEVSGFRYGAFELPFVEKSTDFSKKQEIVFAPSALYSTNQPADNSLSSSQVASKFKESDHGLLTQNTSVAVQLKRDVTENEHWKVAGGTVDADKFATVKDGSCVEHNEVMSTTDRLMHRVSDTERPDFGATKETECCEVTNIMSYKDRHEVSASNCEHGVATEEVGSTLGRDRSSSDAVIIGTCQESGVAGAKQRNDVFSVRPYKDRHEVNVRGGFDEDQDSKSQDFRTYGFFGKPDKLDTKLDDFENNRDDFKPKMGDFPQKRNAFETALVAKPSIVGSSIVTTTKLVDSDGTGFTFEKPVKPVGYVPLGAAPAGNRSTSVPPSDSVSMTSSRIDSSFVATSAQGGATSSNTSVNSAGPTKPTDHSEMVQSLKLFFLSGSLNPDQPSTATTRGRSNSDVNLFRPATVATSLSKSNQTHGNNTDDTRFGSIGSFSIEGQSNVDTSSDSSRIATTHYSSSMDIRSNAASSKENYPAPLVEPSSRHQLPQSSATEGATRIARPGMPPPPPVRRNRPSDSSTTTARRSIEDTSKIVIEDTRL